MSTPTIEPNNLICIACAACIPCGIASLLSSITAVSIGE